MRIRAAGGRPDDWIAAARRWRSLGATHVCLNGIVRGTSLLQQLETAFEMKRAVEDVLRS